MGFVTEITYPDETTETFVYQTDFHALTDATDERGTVTHYEYDEDGHVIAITDAYGTVDAVTTNYVWEGGLLVEVRDDGDNLLFEYEYDAYSRKISELDGEANEQTWTYDVNGNIATWTDGRGITTSYTNDAKGRVLSVTIDSVTQKFEYDAGGSLTRMIDADGTYFDTEYDSRGNVVRSIAGSNTSTPIITRNVFDDADQLIGVYDSNGNYTAFEYDAVGRLVATTDALGNSDRIAYNAAGEMIGYRDVLGNWTRYKLDEMGQVEAVTDALGNETSFTYNDGGLVTVVEDALGKETLYTYNARGQVETSEDADGVTLAYAYDANGLLLSITDDLGRVTTYGRDALGRVTSVTEADGTASERLFSFTLDENGNVIESTDPLSRDTTYEYDDFDRVIETTDAAGNVWEWTYADNGNVLTETYNGKTTTHAYDALGRRVLTTDADNRETHLEYGNDGWLMRVIDGEENATEYLYDALGRLVLTIAADGGTTEQRYDAASNIVALIDPVGNTTTWQYDRRYQVVSETDPLGEASFAIYDEVGRAASTTDRLGRTKVYTWSDAGRLLTEEWYDSEETLVETLTYTYYEDGRLHTATNSAGTYTYTYDDLGRVATVEDPNGITLTYGWNEVDDLVTLTDSEGGVVASVYDEAHRLIERAQSGTGVESLSIQIDYDEEGRRGELRRYSDATGTTLISTTEFGYDDAGNLTSLIHKDDAGDPLVTYVNTFDENSRITSETRNSVTVNYEYDATSQVIDDDTNEYEYDLNGNRTMDGYSTGAGNRIETDGTWTYEYDLEGNLIKKSQGEEDETWTYGYDHNNRLLWVEKADTDGGIARLRVEFTYDVFGNRIAQQVETFDAIGDPVDSETHRYALICQQVWADLDDAGDIVTRYLLGDSMGERIARSGDGDTFWLLTDRLGSIREVLDETGELVNEISYDSFGNVISETAPSLSGDYLFTGLRWFAAIDLYGTPNRDYDPTIAKWLQNDPIGFNGGLMNLSGYVGNNGMNATDLSGLQFRFLPAPATAPPVKVNPTTGVQPHAPVGTVQTPFVHRQLAAPATAQIPLVVFPLTDIGRSDKEVMAQVHREEQDWIQHKLSRIGIGNNPYRGALSFASEQIAEQATGPMQAPGPSKLMQWAKEAANCLAQDDSATRGACFTGRMPIETEQGPKRADEIKLGDLIWSQDEFDPEGNPALKCVEEVFEHTAAVLNVHVGGQIIETTSEHPFYVRNKNKFVAAKELEIGDLVQTRDKRWLPVEGVASSGLIEKVYNFRIAEYHTYFVGCDEWGFSVWAHNACLVHYTDAAGLAGILATQRINPSTGPVHARHGDGQYFTDILPTQVGGRTVADLTPADVAAGRISLGQLSSRLYAVPWNIGKVEYYVIVDVTGQNVQNPVQYVYLIPNTVPLNVTGKIVASGKTLP